MPPYQSQIIFIERRCLEEGRESQIEFWQRHSSEMAQLGQTYPGAPADYLAHLIAVRIWRYCCSNRSQLVIFTLTHAQGEIHSHFLHTLRTCQRSQLRRRTSLTMWQKPNKLYTLLQDWQIVCQTEITVQTWIPFAIKNQLKKSSLPSSWLTMALVVFLKLVMCSKKVREYWAGESCSCRMWGEYVASQVERSKLPVWKWSN